MGLIFIQDSGHPKGACLAYLIILVCHKWLYYKKKKKKKNHTEGKNAFILEFLVNLIYLSHRKVILNPVKSSSILLLGLTLLTHIWICLFVLIWPHTEFKHPWGQKWSSSPRTSSTHNYPNIFTMLMKRTQAIFLYERRKWHCVFELKTNMYNRCYLG